MLHAAGSQSRQPGSLIPILPLWGLEADPAGPWDDGASVHPGALVLLRIVGWQVAPGR